MTTFWQAVLYTHLLAMAFFLGGQLVVGLALVPVERRNPDPERLRAVARRFGIGSAVALAVLLATGIAMAEHFSMWSSETLRLKLVLVGVLIALTVVHLRFPRAHALQGLILVLTLAVVWLGLDLAV
jgi:putative copper export protein